MWRSSFNRFALGAPIFCLVVAFSGPLVFADDLQMLPPTPYNSTSGCDHTSTNLQILTFNAYALNPLANPLGTGVSAINCFSGLAIDPATGNMFTSGTSLATGAPLNITNGSTVATTVLALKSTNNSGSYVLFSDDASGTHPPMVGANGNAFAVQVEAGPNFSTPTGWQGAIVAIPGGNVGIDTSTPQATLDVNGNAKVSGSFTLGPLNAQSQPAAWFDTTGNLNMGYGAYWMTNTGAVGVQELVIAASPIITPTAGGSTAAWFDSSGNSNFAYGNVAITSDGSTSFGWYDGPQRVWQPATVSIDVPHGIIWASNNVTWSDRRLKTDIKEINDGIDTIMALRPVSYLWKDDKKNENLIVNENEKARKYGFLAQDVEKVLPDLVQTMPASLKQNKADDTLGLDYQGLFAPLVKAVQEQQAEIQMQHDEIEALKAELAKKQP